MKGYLSRLFSISGRALRRGFTLLELVIFTAIFSVTIIAFISVLISITRTQVRQTAVTEVNQQSQFVLQALQYYVERSSAIDATANVATSSMTLRMPASLEGTSGGTAIEEDPTLIFASGTQIYSQVGGNPAQALTSPRVLVTDFLMTRHSNPPAKDTLSVSFTISYNTANPQQQFIQSLTSAVARVNAATFDSGIYPVSQGNSANKLGASGSTWNSVNEILYFNSANSNPVVGVGIIPPSSGFSGVQVHNGDIYVDNSSNGIILNGGSGCYRITVDGSGNIATSSIGCP